MLTYHSGKFIKMDAINLNCDELIPSEHELDILDGVPTPLLPQQNIEANTANMSQQEFLQYLSTSGYSMNVHVNFVPVIMYISRHLAF